MNSLESRSDCPEVQLAVGEEEEENEIGSAGKDKKMNFFLFFINTNEKKLLIRVNKKYNFQSLIHDIKRKIRASLSDELTLV